MLNIAKQDITIWENQNSMPDIEDLKTIARIFDVTIDSLVYEEEEIETTDDALCWNIAFTLGIVGLILSFLFKNLFNNIGISGIGFGAIGYLLTKMYLSFKSKKNIIRKE